MLRFDTFHSVKKIIFICFIWIVHFSAFGQIKQIDSLKQILLNAENDTNRVKTLNKLAWMLRGQKVDSSISLNIKARSLSEKLKWKKGIGTCLANLGVFYRLKGNYDSAQQILLRGLKYNREEGNQINISSCLGGLANVNMDQGNYSKALQFNLEAIKIDERIGNKSGFAVKLGNIGIIYKETKNVKAAYEYYQKALKINREIGDKKAISLNLMNIGNVFKTWCRYDSAFKYYTESRKLSEELGDKTGVAQMLGNLSNVYFLIGDSLIKAGKNEIAKKDYYPKALECSKEYLKISTEVGNEKMKTIANMNIGSLLIRLDDLKDGEGTLLKALSQAKKNQFSQLELEIHENLSEVYSKSNPRKALEHYKYFIDLRDRIFNEDNTKKMVQIEMNSEFDKKEAITNVEHRKELENQRKIAEEKSKQQTLVIGFVCFVLILVVVFAIVMFNRFKITQKQKQIIEIKEQETQKQNLIITEQKKIVDEKHKEITDSINYAERIQRSFLATKELLDANLKEYFIFFKPKDIVSGDFYWACKLNNGNFALATADSTGHGVPGAIMSLLNVTSLEKAIEQYEQPADILNTTRKTIIERLKKDGSEGGGKDGMDVSLTVYDYKNNKLIISAANNPVWIVRGNETIEIKPDKMPVGKSDMLDVSFSQKEIELKSGDVVYTLTDGFPDQFGGEKGKKFLSKNLRELLSQNAYKSMSDQKELLTQTFKNWVGKIEQTDDVTIIGVRI